MDTAGRSRPARISGGAVPNSARENSRCAARTRGLGACRQRKQQRADLLAPSNPAARSRKPPHPPSSVRTKSAAPAVGRRRTQQRAAFRGAFRPSCAIALEEPQPRLSVNRPHAQRGYRPAAGECDAARPVCWHSAAPFDPSRAIAFEGPPRRSRLLCRHKRIGPHRIIRPHAQCSFRGAGE